MLGSLLRRTKIRIVSPIWAGRVRVQRRSGRPPVRRAPPGPPGAPRHRWADAGVHRQQPGYGRSWRRAFPGDRGGRSAARTICGGGQGTALAPGRRRHDAHLLREFPPHADVTIDRPARTLCRDSPPRRCSVPSALPPPSRSSWSCRTSDFVGGSVDEAQLVAVQVFPAGIERPAERAKPRSAEPGRSRPAAPAIAYCPEIRGHHTQFVPTRLEARCLAR